MSPEDTYPQVEALAAEIERQGGFILISAKEVRNACGFQRLKIHVREEEIPNLLKKHGLGFIPGNAFPDNQDETVFLYKLNSIYGHVIAVSSGSPLERSLGMLQLAML